MGNPLYSCKLLCISRCHNGSSVTRKLVASIGFSRRTAKKLRLWTTVCFKTCTSLEVAAGCACQRVRHGAKLGTVALLCWFSNLVRVCSLLSFVERTRNANKKHKKENKVESAGHGVSHDDRHTVDTKNIKKPKKKKTKNQKEPKKAIRLLTGSLHGCTIGWAAVVLTCFNYISCLAQAPAAQQQVPRTDLGGEQDNRSFLLGNCTLESFHATGPRWGPQGGRASAVEPWRVSKEQLPAHQVFGSCAAEMHSAAAVLPLQEAAETTLAASAAAGSLTTTTTTVPWELWFWWGWTVATAMHNWMQRVTWRRADDVFPNQEWGVSWFELCLSFTLDTQLWLPTKRTDAQGEERMMVIHSYADMLAHQVKFTDWVYSFSLLFDQVIDLTEPAPRPKIPRKYVKAVYVMGARQYSSGFVWRAKYPQQELVIPILCEYFQRHKGPTFPVLPNIPVEMPNRTATIIHQEVRETWKVRTRHFRRAAKKLKELGR